MQRTQWLPCMGILLVGLACGVPAAAETGDTAARDLARQILDATGVTGGLVVHLGCGEGRLTAALHAGEAYLIHGLDTDAARIGQARAHIASLGLYGPISVDTFDGRRLPYADNLVNLVVAEDLGGVPMTEVMRALAAGGKAYVRSGTTWQKTLKPRPKEIDDWPQYLHGADNNAVARDTVAGPPRHLQWTTSPVWSRSHMTIPTVISLVSSGGRLMTIEDTATPENPFLPGRFALVARDAFNGLVLWRHPFAEWEPITRYVKDIAVQLQRRLAVVGDTVYCTPGLEAPLTAFDAATGRVVRTYAGTEHTQEFACDQGVLYAVIGDRMNAAQYNIVKLEASKGVSTGGSDPKAPFDGTGWRGAYGRETPDRPDPVCSVAAIDAASGKTLWKTPDIHGYVGCTLAVRGPVAVYQTTAGYVCLNRQTGDRLWRVDKPITTADGTEANTLILSDTAFYAQEGKALCAYALKDGSAKWHAPIATCYEKSADLFLVGGTIWTGGQGSPTAYDAETGRQTVVIKQRMTGPMSHDRCYRNFITERFFINSKTGGADFLTLDGKKEFPNYWTRGTCGMGVIPCNGLLYAPPFSCQCSIGAMIQDLNALAPEPGLESSGQKIPVRRSVRLVKGEAYGQVADAVPDSPQDWPTYRHNAARGGATAAAVPAQLVPLWKTRLKASASAPVVAAGKVFVADVDAHTVVALDATDGREVWSYVAGGRVDSPPTFSKGAVLFGSRDGWVHCLRASDGRLVWRFKDLPDRLISAFGQLESAWPVCGSVLVKDDIAYFAAGRSSFLDGGIFLYGLKRLTGEVVYSRHVYGPFDPQTGFPATNDEPFKADILVTDGQMLYVRHRAFKPDLTDAASPGLHLVPTAGFLDPVPQHRTYWTIGAKYGAAASAASELGRPSGDILVTNGKQFYEVRGFLVKRHSYFDPRVSGYKLVAGAVAEGGGGGGAPAAAGKGKRQKAGGAAADAPDGKWTADIPLTGRAMVLAGDVLFVAGTPAYFPPDHPAAKYEAAYAGKLGGVLWAASATSGKELAKLTLDAAPVWDALAASGGRLYLADTAGYVHCFGPAK